MSTLNNAWTAAKTFFTAKKRWRWFSLALASVILAALAAGAWALSNPITPVKLDPGLNYLVEITPKYGVDEALLRCLARKDALQASISRPKSDAMFTWGNGIVLEGAYSFRCFDLPREKVKVEWFLDGQKLLLSKLKGTLTGANVGKHRVKLVVSYDTYVDTAERDFGVEVPNTGPSVNISNPKDGAYFAARYSCATRTEPLKYCVTLTLSGSGYDNQDGPLSGNSLIWRLGNGKLLGYGASITLRNFFSGDGCKPKTYTIILTAKDSKGLTRSDSAKITVDPSGMC